MARKLSRRALATYAATQLVEGAAMKPLAERLAAYLLEAGRSNELDLVVRDIAYYLGEKGYVFGTVTTARELGTATKQSVEAFAQRSTQAAQVTLETRIDPAVLGGIKLSLPGKQFDATIARSLTTLKTRFKKA